MVENGIESRGSAPIVVSYADDNLSKLVIRVAAERDDVEIVEVDIGASKKIEEPGQLSEVLKRSSAYGSLPESPLDESKIRTKDAKHSEYADLRTLPLIASRGWNPDMDGRYFTTHGVSTQRTYHDLGLVVMGTPKVKSDTMRTPIQATHALPGLFIKQRFGSDTQPIALMGTVYCAAMPVIDLLSSEAGLVTANIVEMRSYSDGQFMIDRALEGAEPWESRSVTQGTIRIPETGGYVGLSSRMKDIEDQLRRTTVRSYSTGQYVGARAVVSAVFQDRLTIGDIRHTLSSHPDLYEVVDNIVSSIDVKGNPSSTVLCMESITKNGNSVNFDIAYDPDWSRAHRLLDVARDAYWTRAELAKR